jgi:hypothetical protein
MQLQGQVSRAALALANAGTTPPVSQGLGAEALVTELFPKWYNLANAGYVFGTAYTGAALAAPSATALGSFGFWNKASSTVNVALIAVHVALINTTAAASVSLVGLVSFPTQTPSSITGGNAPQNVKLYSGNASQVAIYTAATIVGGQTIPIRAVASLSQDLTTGAQIGFTDYVDGAIIVPPGCGFGLAGYSGTAADTTIACSMLWAEIPTP